MFGPAQSLTLVQHPNGGPKSRWTSARLEELRQHAARGLSGSQIGALMGVSRNAILGKCDREGIRLLSPRGRGARSDGNKIKRKLKRNYGEETARRQPRKRIGFVFQEIGIGPLRIGLLNLESFHCRAVVDGETDDDCLPLYCGHPIVSRSYCAAHAAANYRWGRR